MNVFERGFLTLLLQERALKFGQFTLKSGRQSPYFINMGCLNGGDALHAIGEAYARLIQERIGTDFDVLFGPAYKGIPLAVATCEALWRLYGVKIAYASDRKEAKDHGDRGCLLGADLGPSTRVVYIDDVVSAGTSMRHVLKLFSDAVGCTPAGAVVAVDRQERGMRSPATATREIETEFGIRVHALLRIRDVVEFLRTQDVGGARVLDDRLIDDFFTYLRRYGGSE